MTLEEKVKQIIVESLHSNESEVTPNAHIVNDLGADSLDQAELMMNIEDAFKDYINGTIEDSESAKLDTVGSVIEFLRAKGVPEEI
ncbi:MAG: acyl carrier protein [Kiritimatiellaeota bacterium]|nr:acyl carrier protein [Kiritimatiellota bacterium]